MDIDDFEKILPSLIKEIRDDVNDTIQILRWMGNNEKFEKYQSLCNLQNACIGMKTDLKTIIGKIEEDEEGDSHLKDLLKDNKDLKESKFFLIDEIELEEIQHEYEDSGKEKEKLRKRKDLYAKEQIILKDDIADGIYSIGQSIMRFEKSLEDTLARHLYLMTDHKEIINEMLRNQYIICYALAKKFNIKVPELEK